MPVLLCQLSSDICHSSIIRFISFLNDYVVAVMWQTHITKCQHYVNGRKNQAIISSLRKQSSFPISTPLMLLMARALRILHGLITSPTQKLNEKCNTGANSTSHPFKYGKEKNRWSETIHSSRTLSLTLFIGQWN